MTFVISEKCLGERYATCVSVCPVDCMHPGEYKGQPFLVIDPEECIDCGVCQPECPIDAILESEDDSPEWAKINAELSPSFKNNSPVEPRPANDPPHRPENKLR
ncbi:MAG: ferredoxin family protein [Nitrospinota bacterium]